MSTAWGGSMGGDPSLTQLWAWEPLRELLSRYPWLTSVPLASMEVSHMLLLAVAFWQLPMPDPEVHSGLRMI